MLGGPVPMLLDLVHKIPHPRPHVVVRKRHRGEAWEQAVGDAVLVVEANH